ncbi:M24 family metallopeptidase [Dethiosulfatarculus sandiegensis]|uniref:X-Pro dipeptidase n=1 Tax=Dethiosulfatarculus sandiegensis TaxID=1429043 RepID=A0A0D2JIW3_9BACT|nr:M24 family metallopeptidase [Dethiosulfatarculus sandiegensis]KIX15626.1 X-Pro dipeptidase [Dethiosulfatarculus sandiegensis]
MPVFKKEDYQVRVEKVKQRMAARGLDLLVVSDPANMNYLTGYDGWSFYVPQVVIVSLEEDVPSWIGRGMDTAGAKYTTYLPSQNIKGYPDNYIQTTERHPIDFVCDFIKEKGWEKSRVGVETDAYYWTARSQQSLEKGLPEAKVEDANLLVNWVRLIKSDAEIALMRQAGKITEKVLATAMEVVAPGVRECDAVAAIYQAQISGTNEYGGDYTSIVPMMPTGEKTSTPHLTWTDEPYENEVAVNLELAACRHRYHSPMARTLYLGKNPPAKLVSTAEVVVEGLHAALDSARAGVEAWEVELAWRKVIAKQGLEKESRIGYSVGLNYPPDWGEHTASLRPKDTTVLKPNMTFHMILGMWMDGWGFECSEAFRVTEGEAETFADFPRKLFIK